MTTILRAMDLSSVLWSDAREHDGDSLRLTRRCRAGPPERRCPRCGSTLAPDQEWCLACGAAAGTEVVEARGWRVPMYLGGGLVALAILGVILAIVALSGGKEEVATATPTPAPSARRRGDACADADDRRRSRRSPRRRPRGRRPTPTPTTDARCRPRTRSDRRTTPARARHVPRLDRRRRRLHDHHRVGDDASRSRDRRARGPGARADRRHPQLGRLLARSTAATASCSPATYSTKSDAEAELERVHGRLPGRLHAADQAVRRSSRSGHQRSRRAEGVAGERVHVDRDRSAPASTPSTSTGMTAAIERPSRPGRSRPPARRPAARPRRPRPAARDAAIPAKPASVTRQVASGSSRCASKPARDQHELRLPRRGSAHRPRARPASGRPRRRSRPAPAGSP